MIKKNLFSSKYLMKEKNSYTVFKQTIFYFNAYFVLHIFWLKDGILDFQYLKSNYLAKFEIFATV